MLCSHSTDEEQVECTFSGPAAASAAFQLDPIWEILHKIRRKRPVALTPSMCLLPGGPSMLQASLGDAGPGGKEGPVMKPCPGSSGFL